MIFKKIINYFLQKKFIRFAISGGIATVVDISLLYILTEWLGIWYLISSVFSFLVGSITHFSISRAWVFDDRGKKYWQQYKSFFVIHLVGLAINTAALYILVEYFDVYYIAAKIITVIFGVSWTFWANKKLTFEKT
ncbi:GtrA family protein [Candidatus Kuenenbacteria bacterium]|nr:GtrA family protein [Candidatus Kuenenbacteria bacterium]